MIFEIFKAFPPDREDAVVQIHVRHDSVIDVPIEIHREQSELRITIFGHEEGAIWEYPAGDFLDALRRAVDAIGGG